MRDRPVGESIPRLLSDMNASGSRMRIVPAATATSLVPALRAWTAWASAIKLDEQAVSIVIVGPCQSKKYDTLLEALLAAMPGALYLGMWSKSRLDRAEKSLHIWPTNTAVLDPWRPST